MEKRILSNQIPRFHARNNEGVQEVYFPDAWTPSTLAPTQCYMMTKQIDLTGKSREDMTFFPASIYLQESGCYMATRNMGDPASSADAIITVTDVIHNAPLELDPLLYTPQSGEGPSFFETQTDWDQILFGRWVQYGSSTNYAKSMGVMLKLQEGTFGSMEPTINEKLSFTRIIYFAFLNDDTDQVTIPSVRYVLGGIFDKEDKLDVTWRRYRSYTPSVQDGTH